MTCSNTGAAYACLSALFFTSLRAARRCGQGDDVDRRVKLCELGSRLLRAECSALLRRSAVETEMHRSARILLPFGMSTHSVRSSLLPLPDDDESALGALTTD